MTYKNSPKVANKFYCEKCDYVCYKQSDYNKHLSTRKHKRLTNTYNEVPKNSNEYVCGCGKSYKHRQSLYSHKTKCNYQQEETPKVKTEDTSNTDMANMMNLFIMFLKNLKQK